MNKLKVLFAMLVLGVSSPVFADAAQMTSAKVTGEAVNTLIVSAVVAIGIVISGLGFYGIYKISDGSSQRDTLKSQVLMIISGALMVGFSGAFSMFSNTWLGGDSTVTVSQLIAVDPHMSIGGASGSFMTKYIPKSTQAGLLIALQAVGLAAFGKGLYLVKDVGSMTASGHVSMTKVLCFLLGGMSLIHLVDVSCAAAHLLGFRYLCIAG